MKQTHEPSAWYAGIIAQVRTETETLLVDYRAMPAPTKPAEVERAAKALLAIAKLADFADRLTHAALAEASEEVSVQRPPNRQERRRLEAESRAQAKAAQRLIRP